jgi:hypothetical protein
MQYSPKQKRRADITMAQATRRFKQDLPFDEGDWGDVDSYGLVEDEAMNNPYHDTLTAFGYKHRGSWRKGVQNYGHPDGHAVEIDSDGWHHAAWKPGQSGVTGSGHGKDLASLQNHLLSVHDALKESRSLLKGVLVEALTSEQAEVEPWDTHHPDEAPVTHCSVCGKEGHPASKHLAKALSGENNQPVEEGFVATRDAAPGSIADDEIEGNDKAEHCPDCGKEHAPSVPCKEKKLLFGDELSAVVDEAMKFSKKPAWIEKMH